MTVTTKPLAVVSGASSGIGRELAGEFAPNGFDADPAGVRPSA